MIVTLSEPTTSGHAPYFGTSLIGCQTHRAGPPSHACVVHIVRSDTSAFTAASVRIGNEAQSMNANTAAMARIAVSATPRIPHSTNRFQRGGVRRHDGVLRTMPGFGVVTE